MMYEVTRYIRKINGISLAFYAGDRDRNFFKIAGRLGIDHKELCYWTRALCKLKSVYNDRLHMVLITEKLNDLVHQYEIIDDEKEKEIFQEVDKLFEESIWPEQKLESSPKDELLTRYFPDLGNNIYAWMITQTAIYVAGKKMRDRDNISLFNIWGYFEDTIFKFMTLWTIIDPDIVDEILAYIECFDKFPTEKGDEYVIYLVQQKIDQIEKRVKDFKEMNSMDRKLNMCWACEEETDKLFKVSRPLLAEGVDEMECQKCAKLSDMEYMKKMDEKWNKKIDDEVNKEFDTEINREYETEISKEYETGMGEVCRA